MRLGPKLGRHIGLSSADLSPAGIILFVGFSFDSRESLKPQISEVTLYLSQENALSMHGVVTTDVKRSIQVSQAGDTEQYRRKCLSTSLSLLY